MFDLIAVVIGLLGLAAVLLSALTFARSLRLQAEVTRLRQRVEELERRAAAGVPPHPRVEVPSPAPPAAVPRAVEHTRPPLEPHAGAAVGTAPAPAPPDLEERIGARWLQQAGLVVLVLGVAFFLRYAFELQWLSPTVRVTLGGIGGVVLAAGGLRLSRTYRRYGLLLAGGGAAAMYLSVYAGLNLYALYGSQAAFVLLAAITAAAAWLADRADSLGLGVFAVCGGYATPFLVGGDRDAQLTLFSYVALLVAATMYLAHRRRWPWLNVVSFALTAITVLAWAVRYYTPERYLRTELFLTLYCAMFVAMLRRTWRSGDATVAALLLLAPLGYHLWSVRALAPHGLAFLLYVIAVTAVAVAAGIHYRSSLLRAAAWAAVAVPLGGWIETYGSSGWIGATVAAVIGIYVLHLAAHARLVLQGEELDELDVAVLHANGVGVYAALYQVLADTLSVAQIAAIAIALAVANLAAWSTLRRSAPVRAMHWLGVAATLVAVAIWVQLGGPWAVAAWATEGAAVFWIGVRAERHWLRAGGWLLMGLALFRWLQPDIQGTPTSFVVLANARALTGIYLTALLYVAAWTAGTRGGGAHERGGALIAASVVTLVVISTEISSFWAVRAAADASIAREMMLSASWVAYAALLVIVGMRRRYPPIRYLAIGVFGVSLLKVFFVDLQTLQGVYRIVGFLVVGLILLLVSFLYQRASLSTGRRAE